MKKDRLFGLSGRQSVALGIVVYLVARFIDAGLIVGAALEVIALWFFILGLVRWNRDIKNQRKKQLPK